MKTAATVTVSPGPRDVPNNWRLIKHTHYPWPSVRADPFTEQELVVPRLKACAVPGPDEAINHDPNGAWEKLGRVMQVGRQLPPGVEFDEPDVALVVADSTWLDSWEAPFESADNAERYALLFRLAVAVRALIDAQEVSE